MSNSFDLCPLRLGCYAQKGWKLEHLPCGWKGAREKPVTIGKKSEAREGPLDTSTANNVELFSAVKTPIGRGLFKHLLETFQWLSRCPPDTEGKSKFFPDTDIFWWLDKHQQYLVGYYEILLRCPINGGHTIRSLPEVPLGICQPCQFTERGLESSNQEPENFKLMVYKGKAPGRAVQNLFLSSCRQRSSQIEKEEESL